MEVRLVRSHPRIVENINHVAVMRGPVVYCLEDVDLPKGVKTSEIHFPLDMQVQAKYSAETLGGVTVLEMKASRVIDSAQDKKLYSELTAPTVENVNVKMIPYYAWANRGVEEMTVWVPILMA